MEKSIFFETRFFVSKFCAKFDKFLIYEKRSSQELDFAVEYNFDLTFDDFVSKPNYKETKELI